MPDLRWRFRRMSPSELNRDSMEWEFFQSERLNIRLVRESIQNSLDARDRSGGPVRVRFSLAGIRNPLTPKPAARYIEGLSPHLVNFDRIDDDIRMGEFPDNLAARGMPYLVIEDMGTVGLEGDPSQYDDSDAQGADANHFYWFFRNVGRSGKTESDSGSWGLGKWVFPDASGVSAYIAVAKRASDGETLLMGQCVLQKHTIGADRYDPYGYLALAGAEGLAEPLRGSDADHRAFIERCVADFGLRFRDKPGLSIIIPFPRVQGEEEDVIDEQRIVQGVVHNYFYPIIDGRLEVEVDGGEGQPPTMLTSDTIVDVLDGLDLDEAGEGSAESYRRLFEMCLDTATRPDAEYTQLSQPPTGNENYADHDKVAALRERYEADELLSFRISLDVQRRREAKQETKFSLHVQRDPSLTEGHDYYLRGPLSIPKMDYIKRYPACTLLVVEDGEPLSALLRDSEPPAHTSWRPQNVRGNWQAAKRRIDAVRNAPAGLLAILERPPEGLQKDAFADLFYWDGRGGSLSYAKGKSEPRAPDKPEERPSSSPGLRVQPNQSGAGFQISADGAGASPRRVRLRVAYEAPRGNPLKQYSPHDFRLHGDGALPIEYAGCAWRPGPRENEVEITIDDANSFSFAARGFDRNRDLHVRVEAIAEHAATEEGMDDDTQV